MATEQLRALVAARLDELSPELRGINRAIHANPEVGYKEVFAHETLTDYLEKLGFPVTRRAYGLDTAFEVSVGSGGRQVVVCCEYDALPDIGHGCGHNLIATSSLGAFLGAAHALAASGTPGRLRILGTPAEEGGGGKARLIAAGAFDPREDVAASIMTHPLAARMANRPGQREPPYHGVAGYRMIASNKFRVEFRGATAHAAGEPWNGVNALDAAVAAYTGVSMLRQQIRPDERVHGVFEAGGNVPNVIPDYTRMNWYVRSATSERADKLEKRVKACIESAAHATGCSFNYIQADAYMSIVINDTLCSTYVEEMRSFGQNILEKLPETFTASTDMGNVTQIVPGLHAGLFLDTPEGVTLHSRGFAEAASTDEAHETTIKCAKGMAMLALRVITDEAVAKAAREDFEKRSD